MTVLEKRAEEISLTLGWGTGGYAAGPNDESREGWIDPFGNVWTAEEMVRAFDPEEREKRAGALSNAATDVAFSLTMILDGLRELETSDLDDDEEWTAMLDNARHRLAVFEAERAKVSP